MPSSAEQVLDAAVAVLRRGDAVSMDSVAREAGLSKAGVIHHFRTKQSLTLAVVDRVVARWETALLALVGEFPDDPTARLRAYVEHAIVSDVDPSDLALMCDLHLRDELTARWVEQLAPWLGEGIETTSPKRRAALRAARHLADGVWFNQAFGATRMTDQERAAIAALALGLIDRGDR